MATAIDSSVLLDVLLADPAFFKTSESALRTAAAQGELILCETVVAEIAPVLADASVEEFLSDWGIRFSPSSLASATLAGDMFRAYLQRGGKRGRVVPDFLIAAHAQIHADALLARDRGYYRNYFQGLKVVEPK